MNYIIITILTINIILTIYLITKNNKNNIISRLETNMIKEISDLKLNFTRSLTEDFNKLNERIENKLINMNEIVNRRLDENFDKTNKTFTDVISRLSKIDEAQRKIETLSNDIVSLQSVLTDKKSRGIYGEINLKHILSNIFGEKNDKIYELQHPFNNNTIADAVLYAPLPLGTIAIDSKFPLENYRTMTDKNKNEIDRINAEKLFKSDVKKHIDAISNKYIIPDITSDQAIMFLPAEAIFAEINAYHTDLIDYANNKRVWITSPTTLMSTLTVIQMIVKNIERDKYAKVIQNELKKLSIDFNLYKDRWDKLSRSIETVSKDVQNVHITTEKISKKFDTINSVDIEKLEE